MSLLTNSVTSRNSFVAPPAWRALERILIDYFQRRRIEVSDRGGVTTIDVVHCYELVEDDTISVGGLTELSLEELAKMIAAEWAHHVRD